MKNFLNAIKNYKFKIASAVGLAVLLNFLGDRFNIDGFTGVVAIIVNALILFGMFAFWVGVRNTWVKDDDKLNAIIFGIFGSGFFGLLVYLLFF
jgi:hypothetical protein